MKLDRNELKDLLGISLDAIKKIEKRNKLGERLEKNGFKLVNKYKDKNKYIYEIIKYNNAAKKVIGAMYNTNKADKFITYFNDRTVEKPISIKDIAKRVEVTERTISKWDNELQNKMILSKDGYYYFKIDKSTNEITEISMEEYKSYWKNKAYINAFASLRRKYFKGDITLTELQVATGDIAVIINAIEEKYCFKVKKYKVNKNEIYICTKELIEEYKKGDVLGL